jgi:hypothetical protein
MARHHKHAYTIPADREDAPPQKETLYKVTGTPPPTPVFYEGKLIGWKVYGEEAIYPVSSYRKSNTRLFSKI